MLTALALCVALGLSGPGPVQAQSAEAFGVHYAPSLTVEGRTLTLNGTGVAYRALAKLYAVGLYLPHKSSQTAEVLGMEGPKQLRFVLLRSMRVDELGKVITGGIEHNHTRAQFFSLVPAIRTMGEQFSRIPRLKANDVVTIEHVPPRGTVFLVNDQPAGLSIKDPQFFPAVLKVWLGEQPHSPDLKDALLAHKAQPVLSALE